MIRPNMHYGDLQDSYLFYNIAQKTRSYLEAHPGAHLYRLGIGDVSLPLCGAVIKALHEAVDDYLALCEEIGKSPDKEFRGTFNVRINPALHRELALEADKRELSMNQLVEKAIDCYLHNKTIPASTIKCSY